MPQNELHQPLSQFEAVLGTGIASHQRPSCFIVRSIPMVEKLHQHKIAKNDAEKDFFTLINKAVFSKSFYLYVYLFFYVLMY